MSVLSPKPKNSSLQFWGQIGRNCPSVFEVKPLTNRRPWFWGLTKKLALLVSMCTVQNAYGVTRPPDRLTTEYPTCAIISVPLHHVSYSCHDPRHCPSCHTFHLHTTRQLNVILQMKRGINVKLPKQSRFEFKPQHVNDYHLSNQGTDFLVSPLPILLPSVRITQFPPSAPSDS
jgi:hypothetical protein